MIFDFVRKRTEEGLEQVANIAAKTAQGRLGEALQETSEYVRQRQEADAENLRKLTAGLTKTRDQLLGSLESAFGKPNMELEDRLTQLEETLYMADIGATTTGEVLDDLRAYARRYDVSPADVQGVLRNRLIEALDPAGAGSNDTRAQLSFAPPESGVPTVFFVIGANGMGKTTTIGKLAARLRNEGNLSVLLAACDTFRAAAVDQLVEWSGRANVSIEVPAEGVKRPLPVLQASVARAKREGYDVLIVDTSGRLSNNMELTEELVEMREYLEASLAGAPHETLMVIDASIGRNAAEQARTWDRYVGVSGLVVTKLDGTARAGFVVGIVRDLGIPVKLVGVGEKVSDLRDFDATTYVDALLGSDSARGEQLRQRMAELRKEGAAVAAPVGGGGGGG
eukprot:CAMPEP_0198428972 /NCGR_PEP_ID=MMETSP1452-20131203/6894_1 /TAXON_ID=1181717 /ORGANISM="Synchroma pusillum, Strain CCMP3072" /LENGTH=395 /DNA_ID=CAMNT_0044149373 /DNA_START=1 /DNA_END=1185 /DNA_ORIENTATION=-